MKTYKATTINGEPHLIETIAELADSCFRNYETVDGDKECFISKLTELFERHDSQVATLKAKEPERGYTITSVSNSEEGEQPRKEESQEELWLKAIDFIEVFADGVCNIHKHAAKTMVKHGWILTKK